METPVPLNHNPGTLSLLIFLLLFSPSLFHGGFSGVNLGYHKKKQDEIVEINGWGKGGGGSATARSHYDRILCLLLPGGKRKKRIKPSFWASTPLIPNLPRHLVHDNPSHALNSLPFPHRPDPPLPLLQP